MLTSASVVIYCLNGPSVYQMRALAQLSQASHENRLCIVTCNPTRMCTCTGRLTVPLILCVLYLNVMPCSFNGGFWETGQIGSPRPDLPLHDLGKVSMLPRACLWELTSTNKLKAKVWWKCMLLHINLIIIWMDQSMENLENKLR